MKILHVTPYYPPAWAFGPTPAAVAALARAQAAHGHTVIVLTTDAMAPHERLNTGDAVVDGVRVVRVRNLSGATRTWLGCSTPLGLRHAARRLAADGVDVVHLHELVTVENLRVIPALDARTPIVVSLHRQLIDPRRLLSAVRQAWRLFGGRQLGGRPDHVSASTPEEAAHAREAAAALYPCLRSTVVMPDGIDPGLPDDIGPVEAGSPQRLGLESRGAGVIQRRAGSDILLVDGRTPVADAVATIVRGAWALPAGVGTRQLVVTGPESAAVGAAREAARQRGLELHVQFIGYVPLSRMRQWLDDATLLLLPRGYTGPDTLVVDALTRGVAVLAPDAGSTIASPALIRPLDTDAGWATALASMLEADGSVRRLAAVTSVEPLLWPAVARRWLTLYEELRRARCL